jgi:alpha-beta hydrolase superfamily lysophospholipase
MDPVQFSLRTQDDLNLYALDWAPPGESKAVVCLIHGLGEHCGRYAHVAAAFNQAGYAMLGFDLRGHGHSGGPRGHAPSSEAFLEDIDLLFVEAEKRYPGKPRFLYGHSLGGILVLYYALRRKPQLSGLISTGSGLRSPLIEQKLKVAFAHSMASVLPTMTLSTGLNPEHLSHDPSVVQDYRNDPLIHYKASLAMASSTIRATQWTMEHAAELSYPLLLIHGAADQLTYPSGSQEFARRVSGSCTLRLWEGLYHEIHNEPEKEQVIAVIVQWMDNQLPR